MTLGARSGKMNLMTTVATKTLLVRYGAVPEVSRCSASVDLDFRRGAEVVVETRRGRELGTVLEEVFPSREPNVESPPASAEVLRLATDEDHQRLRELQRRTQQEFPAWETRIREWNLDLQLVDLEWTLDESRLIIYVLNERGPECTKLAIQAAAAGFGIIEVQPVSMEGLVGQPSGGGGCGSCGCG